MILGNAIFKRLKRIGFFIWCAMTLVTLFFYPLIATIHDNLWYLQWSRRSAYEFALTYVVLSALITLLLWGLAAIKQLRLKLVVAYLIGIIPLMSFGIQIIRQMSWGGAALYVSEIVKTHTFTTGVIGVLIVFCFIVWAYARPRFFLNFGIVILLILSSLNILAMWTVATARVFNDGAVNKPLEELSIALPDVYIFLFDELSPDFLYDDNGRIKSAYPNIAALSSISDNYHNATALSTSTFHSIPIAIFGVIDQEIEIIEDEYLNFIKKDGSAERLRDKKENVFSKAQGRGYVVNVFGHYFRYCSMLYNFVDHCRSFSIYNYSTVRQSFSLLNPIITNIILWPHQLPYGWIKSPLYVEWQRRGIEQTYQWTIDAFHLSQPVFLFTHFNIPHLPFVFDRNGFNPARDPFLQSDENYARQVEYVDTIVGSLVAELKSLNKFDNSMIVILSDHNFRIRFPDRAKDAVLIVKHANQKEHKDISDPISIVDALQNLQ